MTEKKDIEQDTCEELPICFVIMPISDQVGYEKGHFTRVYRDIITPACILAGFKPIRADEVKQSNLIHVDMLKKLLESPMAICDLSSRNPNVLFELGLRQAFDKPVTLIRDMNTTEIFDISQFRYTNYRKERIYNEVLEDQENIALAVKETYRTCQQEGNVGSIVKLLAIGGPAKIPELGDSEEKNEILKMLLAEVNQLKDEVRSLPQNFQANRTGSLQQQLQNLLDERNLENLIDKRNIIEGMPPNPLERGIIGSQRPGIINSCLPHSQNPDLASRVRENMNKRMKERKSSSDKKVE